MQPDPAIRILLALILLCLVILIVQGFAGVGDPLERGWARYNVIGMRAGAPLLIRTDSATGEVWKLELRGGHDRWVAFQEPDAAEPAQTGRESKAEAVEPGDAEVVEPPGAPRPSEPPRASAEVLEALPPPPPPEVPAVAFADVPDFAKALVNEALPTDMRVWVAEQLATVADRSATDALLQGLETPQVEVTLAVLRTLEGRDDPRVRPAAEKAAAHADPRVHDAAQRVLDSLD